MTVTGGASAAQVRPVRGPDLLVSQADGAASLLPPAGPQAQGWTGRCNSGHCQYLAEEDEPPPKGWRVRANAEDNEHQGDERHEAPGAVTGAAWPRVIARPARTEGLRVSHD